MQKKSHNAISQNYKNSGKREIFNKFPAKSYNFKKILFSISKSCSSSFNTNKKMIQGSF